ncbi:MAG: hypothetical protein WBA45_14745 [Microthrixaceae bacterium]
MSGDDDCVQPGFVESDNVVDEVVVAGADDDGVIAALDEIEVCQVGAESQVVAPPFNS